MNLKPQGDDTYKIVVQAADRNSLGKTMSILRTVAKDETHVLIAKLAAECSALLAAVIVHYPDTRRGKRSDPQRQLPGMPPDAKEKEA